MILFSLKSVVALYEQIAIVNPAAGNQWVEEAKERLWLRINIKEIRNIMETQQFTLIIEYLNEEFAIILVWKCKKISL